MKQSAKYNKGGRWIGVVWIAISSVLAGCYDQSQQRSESTEFVWVQEEILQQLSELRQEVRELRYEIAELQAQVKSGVNIGPTGVPTQINLGSVSVLGSQNANLAIIEFTDYQCPYCARHNQTVWPAIKENLIDSGKARYVVYDYPLSTHSQAKPAAVAARCAGQQGRYWEMHEILFDNQAKLGAELYINAARELSLDGADFSRCLTDPAIVRAIDTDLAYGNQVNVTGTPKFFVGRVEGDVLSDVITIDGAQAYTAFARAVALLENISGD